MNNEKEKTQLLYVVDWSKLEIIDNDSISAGRGPSIRDGWYQSCKLILLPNNKDNRTAIKLILVIYKFQHITKI